MPSISKIRFTNVVYERGAKRYNDEIFTFQGENGVILLENGGGKTVFIQTALQAVLPHVKVAKRDIRETLVLEGQCAHIAIEWIIHEKPLQYALTAVTLFLGSRGVESYHYVYEYRPGDEGRIENIPFTRTVNGERRAADKGEIHDYYKEMKKQSRYAQTFDRLQDFESYMEENFHIIPDEWRSIAKINQMEGSVETFFDGCETSEQLIDRLLIPTIDQALQGEKKNQMADIFQERREHLRQYKKLKEQIRESSEVRQRVQWYCGEAKRLHEAEQGWEEKRKQARALLQLVQEEKEDLARKLEEISQQAQVLEEQKREVHKKEESLKLAFLAQEVEQKARIHQEEKRKLEEQEGVYKANQRRILSLDWAIASHKLEVKQGELQSFAEELQRLERNPEIEEIKEQLLQVSRQIKGYFVAALNQMEEQLQRIAVELSQEEEKKGKLEREFQQINREREQVNIRIAKLKDRIENNQKKMLQYRRSKFVLSAEEKVEEKQTQWKEQLITDQDKVVYGDKRLKEIQEEKTELEKRREDIRDSITAVKLELSKRSEEKSRIDHQMGQLHIRLSAYDREWGINLYEKQHSIQNMLELTVEKQRLEREQALERERRASRYFDDYKGTDQFTADPGLSSFVSRHRSRIPTLDTGTAFLERALGRELGNEESLGNYPFWTAALVVDEREKEKLTEHVLHERDKWVAPVFIITLQEAQSLLTTGENRGFIGDVVIPEPWREAFGEGFASWLAKQQQHREEAGEARLRIEEQWQESQKLQQEVIGFFQQYPLEKYQEIEASIQEKARELLDLSNMEQELKNRQGELEREESSLRRQRESLMEEIKLLEQYLHWCNEYFQMENENRQWALEQQQHEGKKADLEEKLQAVSGEVSRCQERIVDWKEQQVKWEQQKFLLEKDTFYLKVKEENIAEPEKAIEVLKNNYQLLESRLNERVANRDFLIRERDRLREEIQGLKEEVSRKEQQAANKEAQRLSYFPGAEQERASCYEKDHELERKLVVYQRNERETGEEWAKIFGQYEKAKKDFWDDFGEEPLCFSQPLEDAHKAILFEKREMQRNIKQMEQEQSRLQSAEKENEEALNKLRIANAYHTFFDYSPSPDALGEQDRLDYPYQRLQVVTRIIQGADERKGIYDQEKEKMGRSKETFRRFCQQAISNPRMKQQTLSAIEYRQTYEEIAEWARQLEIRIDKATAIAEKDLQEHDREMQMFIDHILLHVSQVRKELLEIPKKTRVKVDEMQTKEIYHISIGEWEEEQARRVIHTYIMDCTQRLESDKYKTEGGEEDTGKVKQEIEKWFNTKQLLRIVLENKPIKVRCRKVSNDRKLSNGFSTWEDSNKWSGGEKWSKNMALFLGLLDYVAEKKQYVRTQKKTKRVVILDNPFGKASSEHVLDPVFYIAEQLGFQIIALTALAEGNFVRTYFPVVYSCRLRPSKSGDTSIMEAKNIRKAFFIDTAPPEAETVATYQQMDLFGEEKV